MDTANLFAVGSRGETIMIGRRNIVSVLSKEEALNLAAWLVLIADDRNEFPALLKEILDNP